MDSGTIRKKNSLTDAQMRMMLENLGEAVFMLDPEGKLKSWSPAAQRIFGYAPEDIVGFSAESLWDGQGAAQLAASMAQAKENGRAEADIRRLRKDGTRFWAHEVICPIVAGNGGHAGFAVIVRDISGLREKQAQAVISDRMASLGKLAAGTAHEINNPLAAVTGYLEMASAALSSRQAGAEAEILGFLANASEAAQRLRQTVRDLKLFSRPEEKHSSPVDLRYTMEAALRMAWNEIRHRARVVRHYSEAPWIDANESRIGQVFLNLLMNAAQAIPPGRQRENEISVSIGVEGGRIVVGVTDTGDGMRPSEAERIFEVFYTTKGNSGGSGLGLAICKGIAQEMGGDISMSTMPGQGSSFTLSLPLTLACAQPGRALEAQAMDSGKRGKVLLIDDELPLLKIMEDILAAEHDAVATDDPLEALRKIQKGERFDVILCDMMMPQMTGLEFHKKLSAIDNAQAERLIFISGGAFTAEMQRYMERSKNGHMEKPFSRAELRAKVRAVVSA